MINNRRQHAGWSHPIATILFFFRCNVLVKNDAFGFDLSARRTPMDDFIHEILQAFRRRKVRKKYIISLQPFLSFRRYMFGRVSKDVYRGP
jgi:hypothetical protein